MIQSINTDLNTTKTATTKPATYPSAQNSTPTAYVKTTADNDVTLAEIELEQFVNQVYTTIALFNTDRISTLVAPTTLACSKKVSVPV